MVSSFNARLGLQSLKELSNREALKEKGRIYAANVVIKQFSIMIEIVTVDGMLRTRRTVNSDGLEIIKELLMKYKPYKIMWR